MCQFLGPGHSSHNRANSHGLADPDEVLRVEDREEEDEEEGRGCVGL